MIRAVFLPHTGFQTPYLVLAFRGTEKKVSDWLTDARCVPTVEGKTKVIRLPGGIHNEYGCRGTNGRRCSEGDSQSPEAKNESGNSLPLFITGSFTWRRLGFIGDQTGRAHVNGACYTFGAPRVGNYEYFRFIKTPVFRIVNSSDVVPRVPPGALMLLLRGITRAISWLTSFFPAVSSLVDKVEAFLDKLKGYRHYGDQRYLSDVAAGRFQDVRLLLNPPAIDRIVWMWRHLAESLSVPFKCHSMSIYRKKLEYIANERWSRQSDRGE